jgi:uncharacterized membrane protein
VVPFLAHKLFRPQTPSHISQLGSYPYLFVEVLLLVLPVQLGRLRLELLHPLLGLLGRLRLELVQLVQVEAQARAPFLAHKLFHPQSPSHISQLESYSYPLVEALELLLVPLEMLRLELHRQLLVLLVLALVLQASPEELALGFQMNHKPSSHQND